jgi:uncharacterized protein
MLDQKKKNIFIPGSVGKLEAVLEAPLVENKKQEIAIVCHPHPLQEGTMHNKVVTTVSKAFQEFGAWALRFNYRGVGKSEGDYGEIVGEVEDVLSVFHWCQAQFPAYKIHLSGFSFGGRVSLLAALEDISVASLITIAPAIHLLSEHKKEEFSRLNLDCPWLLVQGWEDEVVKVDVILNWCQGLKTKPELWCLPETSHFFHGKLVGLRHHLLDYLKRQFD